MILPSILGEDFGSIKETVLRLENEGVKAIHFDVMDNHFVPNLTFGPKFISDLRNDSNLIFDVHLMISNPLENALAYIKAGANILTSHIEAFENDQEVLDMIKICYENQVQFGISVKPGTLISAILPFLDKVDLVLVMTVEPGFAGQSFMTDMIKKIEDLHKIALSHNFTFIIQVDGGISRENIPPMLVAGARYFVMGTAFFKEGSKPQLLEDYKMMREDAFKNISSKETL